MSAISQDAIPDRHGQPLKFDAPELEVSDPTEDIADEITSELAGNAPRVRAEAPVEAARDAGVAAPLPTVGSVLRDRYVLESLIGGGGTAMVFQALDRRRDDATAGGPRVAVKLLRAERRDDPRSIGRLHREFRQTQSVAHRGVVRFHDLDCDRGTWFIVMELLEGESLAARLRRAAPAGLPRKRALALLSGIADALAHAHARGIVHGDVKPANVLITDGGQARLIDFGVAPDGEGPSEPVAATRAYASAEVQGGAPAEARDDVFSFACLACEALSGEHPFGRGSAKSERKPDVLPRRPEGLNDATWQVLVRALSGSRGLRPDMDEVARALRESDEPADALRAAAAVLPVAPAPTPAIAPAPAKVPAPPSAGSRLVAGALTAAGLTLVLGILIGRLHSGESPAAAPARAMPVKAAEAAPVPAPESNVAAATPVPRGAAEERPDTGLDAGVAPPTPTGEVNFDLPAMTVSNKALVAAIPLRHAPLGGGPRDARVNWRIIEGSARPGQDYGGPVTGVESFTAGNTFRILYVPVVANPPATRDRTFVVELTGASPGVQIGGTPRVAVTILGDR